MSGESRTRVNGWSIAGRTVAITGGSAGIGKAAALALAAMSAKIVIVGRDHDKHQSVLGLIAAAGGKASLVEADLSDLSQVARAGHILRDLDPPLTVLINNAGVAGARGVTVDGFELAFGVNHLAHFLLTSLVLASMITNAPGRILTVSSEAHRRFGPADGDWAHWNRVTGSTRSATGIAEYQRSKAANVAFTVELNKRLAGLDLVAVSIHPGVIATRIWRRIPRPLRGLATRRMLPPELGAAVVVNCATAAHLVSGGYYTPRGLEPASQYATDPAVAGELWRTSEEMVGRWL
ncbi:MAG TPA: SDR family NAD(P)-dependent oxidoreductase [Acidimicrobiia bacterium]|nr:SDR family NAD(P)-dependent oxidoreductase [Acidimicrobiia bacterium]